LRKTITWEKRRPSHALSIARRVQILNKNGSKWLSRLYDRGTTSLRTGNKTETIFQVFLRGEENFFTLLASGLAWRLLSLSPLAASHLLSSAAASSSPTLTLNPSSPTSNQIFPPRLTPPAGTVSPPGFHRCK
jgi:hypothetical protein